MNYSTQIISNRCPTSFTLTLRKLSRNALSKDIRNCWDAVTVNIQKLLWYLELALDLIFYHPPSVHPAVDLRICMLFLEHAKFLLTSRSLVLLFPLQRYTLLRYSRGSSPLLGLCLNIIPSVRTSLPLFLLKS